MSVHAGTIIHVGGNNVIDRLQSAGLGDVRITSDVIREIGNTEVVDKVPQDPDFTFTLESFDVSTELEAWLTGAVGGTGSAAAPGAADADGTVYDFADCGFLNIPSPWKDPTTGSAGTVIAGHLVPGYYPTRIRYQFGVTDDAQQTVELGGGSYYYADGAPVEEFFAGTGAQTNFVSSSAAVGYRKGGAGGTTFKRAFGVIVDGVLQVEGEDYNETGAPADPSAAAVTVSFVTAPKNGADVRFTYFTTAAQAYPQAVHADVIVKPAAVRGRNICAWLGSGAARAKVGSVQSATLEATVDSAVDREFCNEEPVGRTVNGRDCTGDLVVRSKDSSAFLDLVSKVTGVARAEVHGWLNQNSIPLEIQIQNPRNPGQILKTLYVDDAIFHVPGTSARVNTPTDFTFSWESRSGSYQAIKGAKA